MSYPKNELMKDSSSSASDSASSRSYKFSTEQVESIKKSMVLLSQSYSVPKIQLDQTFVRFLIEIGVMPPDEESIHPLFGLSKAKNDLAKINIDIKKMADQISEANGVIRDHFLAVSSAIRTYNDLTSSDSPIQKLLYHAVKSALVHKQPDKMEKSPGPPIVKDEVKGNLLKNGYTTRRLLLLLAL
jgi:hypothetical protein